MVITGFSIIPRIIKMDKQQPKLFMLLIGCKPAGRNIEQHDVFFGIGNSIKELIPQIENFWAQAGKIHIDGWREINTVDGYSISIAHHNEKSASSSDKLFFLNLGGYKKDEFEEFHYKLLLVSANKGEAIMQAKQTAFYKHTGFKGADSHIDDKYGIDVDDIYEIEDILPASFKEQFYIKIEKNTTETVQDTLNLGYFKLSNL